MATYHSDMLDTDDDVPDFGDGLHKRARKDSALEYHSSRTQAYGSFIEATRQHKQNLELLLKESLLRHDFEALPPILLVLLSNQEEAAARAHSRKGYRKDTKHYEELSRYLDVAWEWIRRSPKNWSPEARRQVLRLRHSMQLPADRKEAMLLEVAMFAAMQGDDMRAYDMLTTMPTGFWEQPDRASRALYAGMVKHRQWSKGMQRAAQQLQQRGRLQEPSGSQLSSRKRDSAHLNHAASEGAAWDPFRHDEEAQRLVEPMARSAAAAAETQLQECLNHAPDCVTASYLLFQLYAATGRPARATELAVAAAAYWSKPAGSADGELGEAPDPDALALSFLATEASTQHAGASEAGISSQQLPYSQPSQLSQPSQFSQLPQPSQPFSVGGGRALPMTAMPAAANAADRAAGFLQLLRCDPESGRAARALVAVCTTPGAPRLTTQLVKGLAMHLDACHPDASLDSAAMAWRQLAALLLRCGEGVAEVLQNHPDPPGDDDAMEGSDDVTMLGQKGGEAEDGTGMEAVPLLREWQSVLAILAGHRRWWERLHFTHRSLEVSSASGESAGLGQPLPDKAAVCAFVVCRKSRFCTKAAQLVERHGEAAGMTDDDIEHPGIKDKSDDGSDSDPTRHSRSRLEAALQLARRLGPTAAGVGAVAGLAGEQVRLSRLLRQDRLPQLGALSVLAEQACEGDSTFRLACNRVAAVADHQAVKNSFVDVV